MAHSYIITIIIMVPYKTLSLFSTNFTFLFQAGRVLKIKIIQFAQVYCGVLNWRRELRSITIPVLFFWSTLRVCMSRHPNILFMQ